MIMLSLYPLIASIFAALSVRMFYPLVVSKLEACWRSDLYMSRITKTDKDGVRSAYELPLEDRNPDGIHANLLKREGWQSECWQHLFANSFIVGLVISLTMVALMLYLNIAPALLSVISIVMCGIASGSIAAVAFDWGCYNQDNEPGGILLSCTNKVEKLMLKGFCPLFERAEAIGRTIVQEL